MKLTTFQHRAAALAFLALMGSNSLHGQGKTAPSPPPTKTPSQLPNPEPRIPVPQPLPFSHKLHTQFLQACEDCHEVASDGWAMNYPPEGKCMTCHATVKTDSPAIKKLAEYSAQKKAVPWVPVYRIPDYVYFSHRRHVTKALIDCEACHGAVRERDVLAKEKPTSMAACMSCHKEKGAATGCRTCHDQI